LLVLFVGAIKRHKASFPLFLGSDSLVLLPPVLRDTELPRRVCQRGGALRFSGRRAGRLLSGREIRPKLLICHGRFFLQSGKNPRAIKADNRTLTPRI
jgi:hypothetical protein